MITGKGLNKNGQVCEYNFIDNEDHWRYIKEMSKMITFFCSVKKEYKPGSSDIVSMEHRGSMRKVIAYDFAPPHPFIKIETVSNKLMVEELRF